MRLRIYKQSFANIQDMGMNLRYDLFLDDKAIMCCTYAFEGNSDPDMVAERDRRAVKKLITELKSNPKRFLNLECYATNPQRKQPLYEFTINEATIKEWMLENKMKSIEKDFE